MGSTKRATMIALALAVCAVAGSASAQEREATPEATGPSGVLRIGSLYSFGGGTDLQHGFGMDVRYQLFPEANMDAYVGVYAQSQYELGDAWRFSGGITGGWSFLGFDVGIAHRTATATYAGSTGLQIAQSITFGPVSVGGRITIPLVDYLPQNVADVPSVQGFEGALTVTLAWGFTTNGPRRNSGCCCPGHLMHH